MKKVVNQSKCLKEYLNGELKTSPLLNFFRILEDVLKDKSLQKEIDEKIGKPKTDYFNPIIFAVTTFDIKQATEYFDKGKIPGKLGEGKTRIWFFELNEIKIVLFVDNRGSSWEFETNKVNFDFLILFIKNLLNYPTETLKNLKILHYGI
ncbi:MAG: hypothetical protein ABIP51_16725 [Bacteroidia bacterium]